MAKRPPPKTLGPWPRPERNLAPTRQTPDSGFGGREKPPEPVTPPPEPVKDKEPDK